MPRAMRYCNPQLLQQVTSVPDGAWAFCRLTLNLSTAIFRIRRASDNAELNIYSPSPAAIAAFCGNSNGFVRSVFDQSGNGRHFDQPTAAQQLKIYDGATGTTVRNLTTGTTVGMTADGVATNMTGADSGGFNGNTAMTVSDLHEDTAGGANAGVCFFGKHVNAAGQEGYYSHVPSGTVAPNGERLTGAVAVGPVSFDVRFTGSITGIQSWVAHKPNGGTDASYVLSRNGVNLTQFSASGNAPNMLVNGERIWAALRGLAGPLGAYFTGNLYNLLVWATVELATPNLAALESWQAARRTS